QARAEDVGPRGAGRHGGGQARRAVPAGWGQAHTAGAGAGATAGATAAGRAAAWTGAAVVVVGAAVVGGTAVAGESVPAVPDCAPSADGTPAPARHRRQRLHARRLRRRGPRLGTGHGDEPDHHGRTGHDGQHRPGRQPPAPASLHRTHLHASVGTPPVRTARAPQAPRPQPVRLSHSEPCPRLVAPSGRNQPARGKNSPVPHPAAAGNRRSFSAVSRQTNAGCGVGPGLGLRFRRLGGRHLGGRRLGARRCGAAPRHEVFDRGGQVREAGLQVLEVLGQRPVAAAVTATAVAIGVFVTFRVLVVVRVVMAALTGRSGTRSTAWFARMPAAVGQRGELPGVVPHRQADLLLQRRVVVVEVPEEGADARSGHGRTLSQAAVSRYWRRPRLVYYRKRLSLIRYGGRNGRDARGGDRAAT